MPQVRILPEIISNKIAAGEVVERPASVVKELVENSLDAGSRRIFIDIHKGGSDLVRISDNGHGMSREDALLSVQRHATSKIIDDDDLFTIRTFGFRGEALPSIASVSHFSLVTKEASSEAATRIDITGGKLVEVSETGAPVGTMIEVKNLYFNTPARRKFLKTVNTEMGHIADTVAAFALAFPDVQFRLTHNGRNIKNFSESDNLPARAAMVLGVDTPDDLYEIDSSENRYSADRKISVSGYITKPSVSKNSSSSIILFVNRRIVSDKALVSAILHGYKGRLVKGQFPMAVLFVDIPFDQVDVNVHPAKLQVRFANQGLVFGSVVNAVHNALYHGEKLQVYPALSTPPVTGDNTSESSAPYVPSPDCKYDRQTTESPDSAQSANRTRQSGYISDRQDTGSASGSSAPDSDHKTGATGYAADYRDISEIREKYHDKKNEHTHIVEPVAKAQVMENRNHREQISIFEAEDTKTDTETVKSPSHPSGKSEHIKNMNIFGQFAGTYIIAESENQIVLIDQHAAHERVVYEKLKKRSEKFRPPSQDLAVPEIIQFNYREAAMLEKLIPDLMGIGIEIEPFGGTSFVVKSVPAIINDSSIRQIIRDIAGLGEDEIFRNQGNSPGTEQGEKSAPPEQTGIWLDQILILMACHTAVRANHFLNQKEMEQLLADLSACDNPWHCPHGRPTLIYFTQKELQKRFRRIG